MIIYIKNLMKLKKYLISKMNKIINKQIKQFNCIMKNLIYFKMKQKKKLINIIFKKKKTKNLKKQLLIFKIKLKIIKIKIMKLLIKKNNIINNLNNYYYNLKN